MWLVKGAPNLMQRLSRLPPAPNVTLLDRRKPKSLSWPHANTTSTQQTYIRWCCIDLSNAPRLSANGPLNTFGEPGNHPIVFFVNILYGTERKMLSSVLAFT
jgi:hypothetical protein